MGVFIQSVAMVSVVVLNVVAPYEAARQRFQDLSYITPISLSQTSFYYYYYTHTLSLSLSLSLSPSLSLSLSLSLQKVKQRVI
jgi:hypothetical protein